jgi:hypothetical protein
MKKKTVHKRHAKPVTRRASRTNREDNYVVLVRGWVFMVAFALMLGMGAIVGQYLNTQLNASTPQVAGYSTEAR